MELISALLVTGLGLYFMVQSTDKPKGDMRNAYLYLSGSCFLVWLNLLAPQFSFMVIVLIMAAFGNFFYHKLLMRRAKADALELRKNPPPAPILPPVDNSQRYVAEIMAELTIPAEFKMDVERILVTSPPAEAYLVGQYSMYINEYFKLLPHPDFMTGRRGNTPLHTLVPTGIDKHTDEILTFVKERLGNQLYTAISNLKVDITLPEKIRNEHHQILAGTGQGKTTLLKDMIMRDIKAGHSVVVIDSQNALINLIATKVPLEKLVLVDPMHCPPALNLFHGDTSAELFQYMFAALQVELTGLQSYYFTFVSEMVVNCGGNLRTMFDILEEGDEWQKYADSLDEMELKFFEGEFSAKGKNRTREEICRRIFALVSNKKFAVMVGASGNDIDIRTIIDTGKVLLISTDKKHMSKQGASLLGRLFIAQLYRAAISREEGKGKRTYVYIDEFQDYAEDSDILFDIFEQTRKYEIGLVIAHQSLGRLSSGLLPTISSNTTIKFAGGCSIEDAQKLSRQMQTTPEYVFSQPKGSFAAYVKGYGTIRYRVEKSWFENLPDISTLSAIRDEMRKRYAPKGSGNNPVPRAPTSPKPGGGTPDVPESGEWTNEP